MLSGDDQDNRLAGRAGDDMLEGFDGFDRLFGGEGNDMLDDGLGNDRINGGLGDDILTGGEGSDRFIFRLDSGDDQITDFVAGLGIGDEINLRAFNFTDFADVQSVMIDTDGGALLALTGGSVLFQGVAVSQFAADDFLV